MNKAKKGSSFHRNILIAMAVLLVLSVLVSFKERMATTQKENNSQVINNVVSGQTCINNIYQATQYEKSRLNITKQDNSAIYAEYINNFGKTHKFRCIGSIGKVQLWAEGAKIWMDM